MKVSIVTVCYNSENTILETLNSVLNQNYKNIEHIIVDGNSEDKTKYFLKKYPHKNKKIYYQKKRGIYSAINYGIQKAKGDLVHILHSDDIYQSNTTISDVVNIAKSRKELVFLSDVVFFNNSKFQKISRFYSAEKFKVKDLKYGFMPPHPGIFIKKKIYREHLYDVSFKIAADFEFFLKLFYIKKIKFYYINLVTVRMKSGGISGKNIYSYLTSTIEILKSFKINQLKTNIIYSLVRLPIKIIQFVKFNSETINKYYINTISNFYRKYKNSDFEIINDGSFLNFKKNFILSAMNLAFLGSYAANEIKKNKYFIHWPDGIFSKSISDINLKVPGREILRKLVIPKDINRILVLGNLTLKSEIYLSKLLKKEIKIISLPYGKIDKILKKINFKLNKNDLLFITLPTPKQEIIADYISKKSKYFKIICIGGSIAIASGEEREVPKILSNFEFIWRLRYETLRRCKRLLITFAYYLYGKYFNKKLKNLKIIYEYRL